MAEEKFTTYGAELGLRDQPGTVLPRTWTVTVTWLAPSSTLRWPLPEVKVLVVPAGTVAEKTGVKLVGLVTLIQQGAWVTTTTE